MLEAKAQTQKKQALYFAAYICFPKVRRRKTKLKSELALTHPSVKDPRKPWEERGGAGFRGGAEKTEG